MGARRTGRPHRSLRPCWTDIPLRAGSSGRPFVALNPLGTLRASGTSRAYRTLRARSANNPLRSRCADISGITL